MANIGINITQNGTTTLATAGKYCDRNIDVNVDVAGGGGGIDESVLNMTGDCQYRFAYDNWNKFIELYGDRITTNGITSINNMFYGCKGLKSIPFTINGSISSATNVCASADKLESFAGLDGNKSTAQYGNFFNNCYELKEIGPLKNLKPSQMNGFFKNCYRLRTLPSFEGFDNSSFNNSPYAQMTSIFHGCYSLRQVPESFISLLDGKWTTSTYHVYANLVRDCWTLDEIIGIPINTETTLTSLVFDRTFTNCYRLKEVRFVADKSCNWKGQTIDLTTVGFAPATSNILNYNSGITADKEVTDNATYQVLKNDVDWFTCDVNYSRYNHDSAVNTINSLPDTSAYLATAGGTNTIKFKGAAGALTDGGAINTLTEAEIAVAAAKGWTVSLV